MICGHSDNRHHAQRTTTQKCSALFLATAVPEVQQKNKEFGVSSADGVRHAEAVIALRRFDEQAKVPGQPTPALEHFRPYLEAACAARRR
jgi:predicted HD phosphohydrolase